MSSSGSAAPSASAPSTPIKHRRRSARVLEHDPIVAEGFGTRKDLQRLAKQLSIGGIEFTEQAVAVLMRSRGRGIGGDDAPAAPPASSAWADFMKEEGVEDAAAPAPAPTASSASAGVKRSYQLTEASAAKSSKKQKLVGGALLQTGTLDASIVGRAKSKLEEPYHLVVPTRILPGVKIAKIFTGCNAVHSIAVDVGGTAYAWGRNEAGQLGSSLPTNIVTPTPLELPDKLVAAAMGKSHTVVLLENGELWATGANKVGQCGVRTFTDVPQWRKCIVPEDVSIKQIACGEDFTVALDTEGRVYSTGSSEYGQLGNGATGEYFVSANKLAFSNCNVLTRRAMFCHAPDEKLHVSNDKSAKVVPIDDEVKIQAIACGKHHTVAVEAASDQKIRVFSWGCGNYGVLGHGVQMDEYFPRNIGSLHNVAMGETPIITAGAHCNLLLTSAGHVYYWGKHRSVGEATMRPQLVDALANNQHVVTTCAAGGQTVVCSTQAAQTVAWGQGPHGELGLATAKSSAKPTFVTVLDGVPIMSVACGYGHTLFIARQDGKEDETAVKKLAELDMDAAEELARAIENKGAGKKK